MKRLGDQIYDVTAWSLPLAFDVEVVTADRPTLVKATPMAQDLAAVASTAQAAASAPAGAPPKVGFLVPWGSATASLVAEALRQGIRLRSADLPFTLGGRAYAAGTVLVAHRRERRDDAGGARRAGAHARRRAGAHRHRVRRQRDVARQRLDGRAQGAARA